MKINLSKYTKEELNDLSHQIYRRLSEIKTEEEILEFNKSDKIIIGFEEDDIYDDQIDSAPEFEDSDEGEEKEYEYYLDIKNCNEPEVGRFINGTEVIEVGIEDIVLAVIKYNENDYFSVEFDLNGKYKDKKFYNYYQWASNFFPPVVPFAESMENMYENRSDLSTDEVIQKIKEKCPQVKIVDLRS